MTHDTPPSVTGRPPASRMPEPPKDSGSSVMWSILDVPVGEMVATAIFAVLVWLILL